ncbi:MAG: hypothetical protein FWD61_15735 [Phycisphaerales bacterium]|nr:hypothetical protein [Phycisphaerales bacterium]
MLKLTDIQLDGLGKFNDAHASFTVKKHHLTVPWEYQYYNGKANLKLRQDGGIHFAVAAGGAWILTQQPTAPSLFVWLVTESGKHAKAFSNFWNPTVPTVAPGTEPGEGGEVYTCTFDPEAARYHVEHDGLAVETEIFVPRDEITMVMTVKVRNLGKMVRKVGVMPVMKPFLASPMMKAWDVPAWYQTSAFTRVGDLEGFWLEMRDHNGNPANRMRAALVSNLKPTTFETVEERFLGTGSWHSPKAVWEGKLHQSANGGGGKIPAYGEVTPENAASGQPLVAAMARDVEIAAGATFEFTMAFGLLPATKNGEMPASSEVTKLGRYLEAGTRAKALAELKTFYEQLFSVRQIKTPDEALNKYTNEFLALQLYQVQNRGFGTYRGVRDSAQDATAVVDLEPAVARKRIIDICGSQRSNGSFLRQFSTLGKHGPNDPRPYVDNGLWVFELCWEYLAYNRDFDMLKEKIDWLDKDDKDSILQHFIRMFDYYLAPENLGEHGLCKIREGDWNDSVNAAGLEGKGETVMVTAHCVYCAILAADMLRLLAKDKSDGGGYGVKDLLGQAERLEKAAKMLSDNMMKHAMNTEGYFNAVFNDAGKWLFSPKDPDGQHRINSTPNTFAVIAGVVQGEVREKVFNAMETLKGPFGWRLFYPPIGHPPIPKLGRIGQGDLIPGLFENGAPYNHGSHGFLARAAWVAGKGDLFYEVTKYFLPYDQQAHPINVTKTLPYAIVNSYSEAMGQEGRGGAAYTTGSIPVAARNAYDGFLGFRPNLHYLVIDPVMPATWETSGGYARLFGGKYTITIKNPKHVQCGVKQLLLDGKEAGERYFDKLLGREVMGVPIASLKRGENHEIVVTLG